MLNIDKTYFSEIHQHQKTISHSVSLSSINPHCTLNSEENSPGLIMSSCFGYIEDEFIEIIMKMNNGDSL